MIEVSHLTKRYAAHTAVEDLSFTVPDGGVYGLLGPNGAGKTTTMNIMTGCLAATSGTVSIGGYDIFEDEREAKRRLGYLPELPPLYMDSTPAEYLDFVARAKGLAGDELKRSVRRVLAETHTDDVANRLMRTLSKGYRQRLGLAQAILGFPPVIILDEPTVGLDPKQVVEIRQLIRNLGRNHTVLLSSHILSEIRAVCDRVLIIRKGRFVVCDTPDELKERLSAGGSLELTAKDRDGLTLDVAMALSAAKVKVNALTARSLPDGHASINIVVEVKDKEELATVINKLNNIQGVYHVARASGK
mgnify:CR=1 FL=1